MICLAIFILSVSNSLTEKPTIGILVCVHKNDAVFKFTLPENQKQIITSGMQTLPPYEKAILDEVNKELENFEEKED